MSTPFDLTETDRLLSTTRAVRKRLDFDRPVPREVVLDCVRLAQQTPTASNAQHWCWLLVDDAEKKRALGDIYARIRLAVLELQAQVADGDAQGKRVFDSVVYLTECIHRAPLLAIPCLRQRPPEDADDCTVASAFGSIVPAIWSFQLALRARGLGSAYTTAHLRWQDEVAELLGLPEEVMQVAMLPVAYTRGTEFRPARRPAPETICHWNGWT